MPASADLNIDLSTVDTSAELQKLSPKNVEAKKTLIAKHTADFHKWLLPLEVNPRALDLSWHLPSVPVCMCNAEPTYELAHASKCLEHAALSVACREGFSLLFYGFGSKKALLESFARECLTDGGVVVFNGYMRSLNIREILLKVASLLRVPRYLSLTSQSKMQVHQGSKIFLRVAQPGPFCRRPAGLLSMIDRLTGCFAQHNSKHAGNRHACSREP